MLRVHPAALVLSAFVCASTSLGCAGDPSSAEGADDADAPEDEVVASTEQELVGGAYATTGQFPSTLFFTNLPGFKGFCTGAKVGPRHILTAAHCVYSTRTDTYFLRAGDKIAATNRVLVDRESGIGEVVTVKSVRAHGVWTPSSGFAFQAPVPPDVALIEIESGLSSVPVAPVARDKVAPGTAVVLQGYGCETGLASPNVGAFARLKFDDTTVATYDRAFAGTVPWDAQASAAALQGTYLFTQGRRRTTASASLCPGDSGGPLYRRVSGQLRVVGINAYYSFSATDQSVSLNNWHTRVDGASDNRHDVGSWLAFYGATIR